ncbi:hypothetical protein SprV_0802581000 [Sparganum proliferum]
MITGLQPDSTYTVELEACAPNDVCRTYGNSKNVHTKLGVPRHVVVESRTNKAFSIFWSKPLEDPDAHYVYKARVVNKHNGQTHTCEATSSDSILSCQLESLLSDARYDVSVSACTSDGQCSDYTDNVLGETLPNPPRNMKVVKVDDSSAQVEFGPAEGDPASVYEYFAVLDPISDKNMYGQCVRKEDVNIKPGWDAYDLMPSTTYHFRTSACHRGSLRCMESEPITLTTLDPKENQLYVAELHNASAYLVGKANVASEGYENPYFEFYSDDDSLETVETPATSGLFGHVLNGIAPGRTYVMEWNLCNRQECRYISDNILYSRIQGVKLKQPTDITQTTALVNWTVLDNGEEEVSYVWVYAVPVDKKLPQQQCGVKNKEGCTLEHLRPDTEYNLMMKACEDAGYCTALKNQATIRTAKPYILESPRDAKVTNVQTTSFSLIWAKPAADIHNSFEYRVSLKTPDDPSIPESSFICETTLVNGNVICPIKNLHTNYSYSITLSVCAKGDMCSNAGAQIIGKTAIKDGYVLKTTATGPHSATVSWSSSQAKPAAEFRVVIDSSATAACTSAVSVGEHTCQVKGLRPSRSYTFKLTECQLSTGFCVDLFSFPVRTTNDAPVQELLNELAKDITQAPAIPTDPTSQLMIRVSYSKLTAPEIGNLKGVSVVITPVEDIGTSDGPNWSSSFTYSATSAKIPQLVGGTYIDPIDGSWELRLPMPEAGTDSELPDENVLLGAGLGTMIDSHDYNGPLAAGTTFAIQLRVYTDLGFGTTASTRMTTEGILTESDPYGSIIAIAVVLASCGLIELKCQGQPIVEWMTKLMTFIIDVSKLIGTHFSTAKPCSVHVFDIHE